MNDREARPTNVLDELRLDCALWEVVEARALRRAAEIALAEQIGTVVDQEKIDDASDAIRRRHGLLEPEMLGSWLQENGLTLTDYAHLVRREALARDGSASLSIPFELALLDQLRVDGLYSDLAARGDEKQRLLPAPA